MRDAFSSYHPYVNFLYFALVLIFSMTVMHPACLIIALLCALAYSGFLNRKKSLRFNLLYMIPLLLVTAALNPLFNHDGETVLAHFRNGNPLTLEAVAYGAAAAVMLVTVISWFSCFNAVMTSDKLLYVFRRVIPSLSMVLSMTLRLVPRFNAQIKVISAAQKCVGRDALNGNLLARARHGIRIISVMVTWAFENAIDTADSMKSRGYGLRGRSAFSVFRFDRRDLRALLFLLLCGGYIIAGAATGGLHWQFFPTFAGSPAPLYSGSLFLAYFLLCAAPLAVNLHDAVKWAALKA